MKPNYRMVTRKKLELLPRTELQAFYDRIGRIYHGTPTYRLDDVRVVALQGDDVWIEVTTAAVEE